MAPPPAGRHRPALGRSLAIQGGGFGLGLAVHMLLSRWLGPEGYGDLSATLSTAVLATTLALLGFDRSASQTVAALAAEERGRLATTFTRVALVTVGTATLITMAITWGGARLAESAFAVGEHPVRHAAFLVPPMALALLLASLLSGLRRPLLAQVLGPLSGRLALLALEAGVFLGAAAPSEHLAVALLVGGWLVPCVLLAVSVRRAWPPAWQPPAPAEGRAVAWRRSSRSFLVATLPLVALEECGILLMELLHTGETEVGIYAAAHRTAGLPLIALAAARQLAVPELAAARQAGSAVLEATLRPYLRFAVGTGIVIWSVFVVAGEPLLGLFGPATEEGHVILVLLGAAYGVFLFAGLAVPLLQLHGEHRLVIGTMAALLGGSLVVGPLVLPAWGGEGLAAAFAVVNLVVLGSLTLQVHRRTGIRYARLLLPDRGAG